LNVIQDDIRDAIEKELCGANERFPLFASLHEAIAVIAEERDEAAAELDRLKMLFDCAWEHIKKDGQADALHCITMMKFTAESLAIEACQVAAMCEKAIQSASGWYKEREDNEKC
jgi:hypothetical protein